MDECAARRHLTKTGIRRSVSDRKHTENACRSPGAGNRSMEDSFDRLPCFCQRVSIKTGTALEAAAFGRQALGMPRPMGTQGAWRPVKTGSHGDSTEARPVCRPCLRSTGSEAGGLKGLSAASAEDVQMCLIKITDLVRW